MQTRVGNPCHTFFDGRYGHAYSLSSVAPQPHSAVATPLSPAGRLIVEPGFAFAADANCAALK